MRDLHGTAPTGFGSAPLRDKNELPEWPDHITSFKSLEGTPPGPNDEWAETHLPIVRLAYVMTDKNKKTLAEAAAGMDRHGDLLQATINSLQFSRHVLQEHWFVVEAALARLSLVLGRNVLDLPDD